MHRSIPSRLAEVDRVCREARELLEAHGLADRSFAVELVTRECLCNAIVHGGRGCAEARVTLELRVGRRWVRLQVADEGPGFPWRRASRLPPDDDSPGGRGLAICALYAERIAFNRTGSRISVWIAKQKGDRRA
jgi:anti-sigma regulatory factor (Ser/Thr protein kinase)